MPRLGRTGIKVEVSFGDHVDIVKHDASEIASSHSLGEPYVHHAGFVKHIRVRLGGVRGSGVRGGSGVGVTGSRKLGMLVR